MASIEIEIPDDQVEEVLEELGGHFGYSPTILDGQGESIPNPQTKPEFVKSGIVKYLKDIIKSRKLRAKIDQSDLEAEIETEENLGYFLKRFL